MYEWSIPIIKAAESKGLSVYLVDGPDVVQSGIISRIEKLKPKFIFLNGHGDDETFYGYRNTPAIEITDTAIFRNKIVFSRACNCAKKMGKVAVNKHDCTSFIGYEYEFVNVRQTNVELKPIKDEISRPIWETSNAVPLSLIKGSTVDEAIKASHKKATHEITQLIQSKELGAIDALKAIIINDEGLKYHGNGSAKI